MWEAGRSFLRVSDDEHGSTEFNPCQGAPTRFAPLWVDGSCVPILYGAETLDAVLMETVFHDVVLERPDGDPPEVYLADLETRRRWTVVPRRALRLGRLDDEALPALGLRRHDLIDTDADTYSETVVRAAHAHRHGGADGRPLDGLIWHSRLSAHTFGSREPVLLLFAGRVARKDLRSGGPPVPLVVGTGLEELDAIANRLGVTLVR